MTDENHDDLHNLHERLRRTADDSDRPLSTDVGDLLGRARRSRRRHRAGVGAAALLTGAALVGTTVGVRAALPDDDRAPVAERSEAAEDGTSAATAPAALSDAEVARRCLPQLAKYDDLPMYAETRTLTPEDLEVVRPRAYTAGDVVALRTADDGGNPVLCLVPEEGREDVPVPFADLEPNADDPARLTELCSEMFLPQPTYEAGSHVPTEPRGKSTLPDLRGAEVAAVDSVGPVVETLLVKDGKQYACALSPMTWDAGPFGVGPATKDGYRVSPEGSATGPGAKSITDESASYYYAAGTMPEDARSVEFTFATGSEFTVPVTDGHYAFVLKNPGPGGLVHYEYRVLDRKGRVLHEGSGL